MKFKKELFGVIVSNNNNYIDSSYIAQLPGKRERGSTKK